LFCWFFFFASFWYCLCFVLLLFFAFFWYCLCFVLLFFAWCERWIRLSADEPLPPRGDMHEYFAPDSILARSAGVGDTLA
jgi:hypothetical protein